MKNDPTSNLKPVSNDYIFPQNLGSKSIEITPRRSQSVSNRFSYNKANSERKPNTTNMESFKENMQQRDRNYERFEDKLFNVTHSSSYLVDEPGAYNKSKSQNYESLVNGNNIRALGEELRYSIAVLQKQNDKAIKDREMLIRHSLGSKVGELEASLTAAKEVLKKNVVTIPGLGKLSHSMKNGTFIAPQELLKELLWLRQENTNLNKLVEKKTYDYETLKMDVVTLNAEVASLQKKLALSERDATLANERAENLYLNLQETKKMMYKMKEAEYGCSTEKGINRNLARGNVIAITQEIPESLQTHEVQDAVFGLNEKLAVNAQTTNISSNSGGGQRKNRVSSIEELTVQNLLNQNSKLRDTIDILTKRLAQLQNIQIDRSSISMPIRTILQQCLKDLMDEKEQLLKAGKITANMLEPSRSGLTESQRDILTMKLEKQRAILMLALNSLSAEESALMMNEGKVKAMLKATKAENDRQLEKVGNDQGKTTEEKSLSLVGYIKEKGMPPQFNTQTTSEGQPRRSSSAYPAKRIQESYAKNILFTEL